MKVVNLFLLSLLVVSVLPSQLNGPDRLLQTTVRTESYSKMCATFPDRSLVSQQDKTDAQNNKKIMQASFKVSGNELINGMLKAEGGILVGAVAALPLIQTQLGLFAGPFVLGLLILFLISPFLCCCCCCPGCCPSKCCQKPDNQQYTKCQLIWPAVVLILASLLIVISSMIGITRASDIEKSYQAVGCSAAITFDDVINGNFSSTGKYFIGMSGLVTTLNDLKAAVPQVTTQMDKLRITNTSSPLRLAYDSGTTLIADVAKIPNGTVGQSLDPIVYNKFDGTGGSVNSGFHTVLGSATSSSQQGAVGGAYTALDTINQGLKTIADAAQSFANQTGTVDSTIDQLAASMTDMTNMVKGYDTLIVGMDNNISSIMKIVTIGVTAFFGVFIGLGVLNIIGTLLMTFCDKFSCRYLIYFTCFIFLILGLLCFLLAFLFSAILPIIYFGCDFLTVSIASTTGFTTNIGGLLGTQLSSYISVCLPGGTGQIINQLGIDLSAINGLQTAVNNMRSYNVTALQSGVLTVLTTLESQIDKYYFTDVYDFSSTPDRDFMAKIANPGNYPGCASVNFFSQDNWVPSLRNSDITCSGTSQNAGLTQCPTATSVTNGQSSSGTCYGCIDSTKVLLSLTSPSSDLSTRYNTATTDCNNWYNDMDNLIVNYYSQKKTKYSPVRTRMQASITSFNSGTGYNQKLTDVGTAFTSIIGILEGIVSTVFDPQYGMIAGLNCLLLGEDINLLAGTTCNKLFNTLFFLRLTLGLAAFGILFALCCTTCSGVRAFKHSQRIALLQPKQSGFNQDQSTITALNQKY